MHRQKMKSIRKSISQLSPTLCCLNEQSHWQSTNIMNLRMSLNPELKLISMLIIPTVSNLKTHSWEIASGVLVMWKWIDCSLIKWAATLFFNNVRRYVPIYIVCKNEIILTKKFLTCIHWWTAGRTGRQLITIIRLRWRVYKVEIVSAYAAIRNET